MIRRQFGGYLSYVAPGSQTGLAPWMIGIIVSMNLDTIHGLYRKHATNRQETNGNSKAQIKVLILKHKEV